MQIAQKLTTDLTNMTKQLNIFSNNDLKKEYQVQGKINKKRNNTKLIKKSQ